MTLTAANKLYNKNVSSNKKTALQKHEKQEALLFLYEAGCRERTKLARVEIGKGRACS
jgi:hypothetical protein